MKSLLIKLIIIWVITVRVTCQDENCPKKLFGSSCQCNSRNRSGGSIEYIIKCDKIGTNVTLSNLFQEPTFGDGQNVTIQSIRSLSISNQFLGQLSEKAIDSPLRLFELELTNDLIETISLSALSNLVDLKKLKISNNPIRTLDLSIISELDQLEIVDLIENKLEWINLEIGKSMQVKELLLGQNYLVNVSDFSDFPNLKTIDLNNNFIKRISNSTFLNLTNLESLNLGLNSLTVIEPYTFASLISLRELNLDHNDLTSIDETALAGLSQLEVIKIEGNKLVEILPHSFVSMNIRHLDLSYQNVKSIDLDAISNCDYLEQINLANNQLRHITSGFLTNLSLLDKIDLSANMLDGLSYNSFGSLDQLTALLLSNNYISSIQVGTFIYLSRLRSLVLNNNLLREINSDMFIGLDNLERLLLDSNKLTIVKADTFKHLTNLDILNLMNNYITTIEANAFAQLTSLTDLELSKNQIIDIAPNIFAGLFNLLFISLSYNKIASIAQDAFVNMSNLIYIELHSNKLKSLGPGVFNGLDSLETLSLTSNNLETINGAFDNLAQLGSIFLDSNKLRRIDNRTFAGVKQLRGLYLNQNPLDEYVDKSVFDRFGPGIQQLDLEEIRANPSKFLNLSRFVMLVYLKVSRTQFRVEPNTFDTIADTLWHLYLRQTELRNLTFLPIYKMSELRTLDLSDNPLDWTGFCAQNTTTRFFRPNRNLQNVYLSNTSLEILGCLGINSLTILNFLDLSNNLIETIEVDIFKINCVLPTGSTNNRRCLQNLLLKNNRIKFIQPGSFDFIRGLGLLSLDGNLLADDNQLVNINFKYLIWLHKLDISNSNLTQIPLFDSDLYANSYQLDQLKLAYNRIESIESIYFDYLHDLLYLDLSNNIISRVESTGVFYGSPKLAFLDLSSNFIDTHALRRIDFDLCINLKHLNLSGNRLDTLGSFLFNSLKKLEVIDISYNQLVQIEQNAFNGLIRLKDLYMFGIKPNRTTSTRIFGNSSYFPNVLLKENFTTGCEFLKFVHVSSIDIIRSNLPTLFNSLKAVSTNKVVNDAVYYYSINIIVNNFDYYKADRKSACELTILLLKQHIHLNLFNDFGFDVFLANCYSLDLISDFLNKTFNFGNV